MNKRHPVIIVGGGVAGVAAAELLSRHGLYILLVDDNAHAGGQLLRRPPRVNGGSRRFEPDRIKRRGMQLVGRLSNRRVQLLNRTQVFGIYPERTVLVEEAEGRVSEYQTERMILATGARERFLPFKEWTVPGVMSTGAAQILVKGSGILPGRRTLIVGCGPLMLVLASELLAHRGGVRAILDQSPSAEKINILSAGPAVWPKLLEGAVHLMRLAAARVPVKQGVRIVEARGTRQLEAVVAARADARPYPPRGQTELSSRLAGRRIWLLTHEQRFRHHERHEKSHPLRYGELPGPHLWSDAVRHDQGIYAEAAEPRRLDVGTRTGKTVSLSALANMSAGSADRRAERIER